MAHRIPGAEFLVISEGSHYSLLEFPDLINERLALFFKKHGFLKAATPKTRTRKRKRLPRKVNAMRRAAAKKKA
jgi:hypothetical protein